ncbi:GPN-loop GTPase 3 [Pelomyxa schiedti]|nr:GPN-loop GTPase 3 [Pelomyxa schiedti]
MGKHAQMVMGPAGSGKSTFCAALAKYAETQKRVVHVVNLDPAAEDLRYEPSIDIRELVNVDDVMEELGYGPNGALMYAMEFLVDHMDWLTDELDDYADDYLIFDCPGQIELYSHVPVMKAVCDALQNCGYQVVALYMIDSHFISDTSKFISGILSCLSAMLRLEVPHLNVLSKVDLLGEKPDEEWLEKFLEPDMPTLMHQLEKETGGRFTKLNKAICSLLDTYSMVNFLPLSSNDPDSVELILAHADHAIQYGEDVDVKEPRDQDPDPEETLPSDNS